LKKEQKMHAENEWDIIIAPKKRFFSIDLKEIFRYRDLILLFVRRDFIANYKQTILGPLWHILQPLITTVTFVIIFGNIANLSTEGTPKVLFYLLGIISWSFFSTCFLKTSATFINNAHIFSKVYFPRLTVPISIVISNLISFFIQFLIFIAFYFYYVLFEAYSTTFNWHFIYLFPFLIIVMASLGLGMGIIISSLTTKYKDFSFLVGFGTQLLMYLSPVIFPLSTVSGNLKYVLLANPMTPIIEGMRAICLGKGILNPFYLFYSCVFAFTILTLGILLFNKVERSFNDTI